MKSGFAFGVVSVFEVNLVTVVSKTARASVHVSNYLYTRRGILLTGVVVHIDEEFEVL